MTIHAEPVSSSTTRDPTHTFVGRQPELHVMHAALDEVVAGRGSLVLLAGEPGIGKSRMLEEVAAESTRRGLGVRFVRCYEGEGAPPLWPWVQVLRAEMRGRDEAAWRLLLESAGADVATVLRDMYTLSAPVPRLMEGDSPQLRFRLFQSVVSLLDRAARLRPLVILLDDLHGAELATLLLLDLVVQSIREIPLLIVGTYRTAGLEGTPLASKLPDFAREPTTRRLELHGLTQAEIAAFVQHILREPPPPQAVDALVEHSGGNPLFLVEIARAMGGDLRDMPETLLTAPHLRGGLRTAIGRHLVRLSAECRALLRTAAVFGREFTADAVAALLDQPPENLAPPLDEALALRVIQPGTALREPYQFVHALVRDALYAELSSVQRAHLHRRAAEVLATSPAADEHMAEIAYHFCEATATQAGDPARAMLYARRAAERALRLLAFEEAARLFALALDLLKRQGGGDARTRAELLVALGEAQNRSGDTTTAKHTLLQAAESARSLGDRELLSRAALEYAAELTFPEGGYRDEAHVAILEHALAAWGTIDHPLHARLLGRLAVAIYFTDAAARRSELCARGVTMAHRLGDERTLAQALEAQLLGTWGPDPRRRLSVADELLAHAHHLGDPIAAAAAHQWRFCSLLEVSDRTEAECALDAYRAIAHDLRQPNQLGWVDISRTTLATLEGSFVEAERLIEATLGRGRWLGGAVDMIFAIQMFTVRFLQGRQDELIDPIRAAVTLNAGIPAMRAGLAVLYAEVGRHAEARAEVAPLIEAIDTIPWGFNVIPLLAHLTHACVMAGDTQGTALAYERLRHFDGLSFVIGNGLSYFGSVSHYLAMAEVALGRHEEAARHFQDTLATYEAMRAKPWMALAQFDYATLLDRTADRRTASRARTLIEEALATATTLGMSRLAHRADRHLEAIRDRTANAHRVGHIGSLQRDGDAWVITSDEQPVRLADTKGLQYLAYLIQHPGQPCRAIELFEQGSGARNRGPASSNESTSHTPVDLERARSAVGKRIRSAIQRITAVRPALGRHLAATVTTGAVCKYDPRSK